MNVSATIIAFYLPVFIMVVLYFQVRKLDQAQSGRLTIVQFDSGSYFVGSETGTKYKP